MQIRGLVGAVPCTSSTESQSLALGAKPCGGPEFYLAWPNRQTALPPLHALAARYRQERMATDAEFAVLSDCHILDDPGARRELTAPGRAQLLPSDRAARPAEPVYWFPR